MATIRPRAFPGYGNAALGTGGAVVAIPGRAFGALISVSAPCWVAFSDSDDVLGFDAATMGAINGVQPPFYRNRTEGPDTHIHIAPLTGTAVVTIAFF
jgi:hypothetical protein